jgi:hypothetical protein
MSFTGPFAGVLPQSIVARAPVESVNAGAQLLQAPPCCMVPTMADVPLST